MKMKATAHMTRHLVRLEGKKTRAINVYRNNIPGFWGEASPEILQLAAERAHLKGWKNVVLNWADMPCSCCFDDGFVYLLATNVTEYRKSCANYRMEDFLVKMDQGGEVHRPAKKHATPYYDDNPWSGDEGW